MEKVRNRDEWVRCPVCGHKLFKHIGGNGWQIEVKCHSCKEIVRIEREEKKFGEDADGFEED